MTLETFERKQEQPKWEKSFWFGLGRKTEIVQTKQCHLYQNNAFLILRITLRHCLCASAWYSPLRGLRREPALAQAEPVEGPAGGLRGARGAVEREPEARRVVRAVRARGKVSLSGRFTFQYVHDDLYTHRVLSRVSNALNDGMEGV